MATTPASRHRIPPATGAGSLLGQREEGKDGAGLLSFQTGLPPVQDRWGAREKRGKERKDGGRAIVSRPGSHRCGTGGEPESGERYSGQPVTERKRVCEKTRNQARMRQIEHATPDPFRPIPPRNMWPGAYLVTRLGFVFFLEIVVWLVRSEGECTRATIHIKRGSLLGDHRGRFLVASENRSRRTFEVQVERSDPARLESVAEFRRPPSGDGRPR